VEVLEEKELEVVLKFSIEDTGIGIAHEDTPHLFKPFYQLDNSSTRKFAGTGLGLAISKQLTTLMGGSIGVHSTLGKGSTFWFTIPFKKVSTEPFPSPFSEPFDVILLLDNPLIRRCMKNYLESFSLHFSEVSSPKELTELSQARKSQNTCLLITSPTFYRDVFSIDSCSSIQMLIVEDGGPIITFKGVRKISLPLHRSKLLDALKKRFTNETPYESPKLHPEHIAEKQLILIAEDNMVNQRVAVKQLEKLGFLSVVAGNGYEVLKLINDQRLMPALILMDCQMPEMDGITCTELIRKQEKEKNRKRIPIVAMTANAFSDFTSVCLTAGMDDYLSKPVKLETMRSVLQKWIKLR